MEDSVINVFNDTKTHQLVVCVKNDRSVGSLGVWIGDNPFDFVIPITLCQIIIHTLISRSLHYVLRPIRTPKFVCCVVAGILLGPTFIGRERAIVGALFPVKQSSVLNTVAKVAIAYWVFITSLKMDVMTTLKVAKRYWRFGVIPFFSSFFVTVTLLFWYNPTVASRGKVQNFPNIFTLSSFAVVSETLSNLNLVGTEMGQIALSSAMTSEILQWITMEIQFNSKETPEYMLVLLISVSVIAMICLCIVRPMVKMVIERTPPGKPIKEAHVIIILLGPLMMAALSDVFGIYFLVGPLFYGFVLPSGPPLATTILERSEVIISHFLMPFFYLFIGLRTDITGIPQHWPVVLSVLAILLVGCLVKIIDNEVFSISVMYVLFITSVCIPLIKSLYRHRRVLQTPSIHERGVRTIQSILENQGFNIVSCVHTDELVHSMIALIEACSPTIQSPISIYVVHLIELVGKTTPILLPMNVNNRKSLSVNYPNTNHILRAFENYSNNSSGPVRILSYVNVAPYKSMHEAVCNLAEDSSVHVIIIPFHQNDNSLSNHVATKVRELNASFLANAQCTVGILVDRYSMLSGSSSKVSFHVGICFIGGKDDREALALGIRMLERMNTRVTLFRFVVVNKEQHASFVEKEEEILERTLDESLVDEFKANKNFSSDFVNVMYHEIVVEDCIQVLEAIRGMENDYDLVMVGKRHSMGDLMEEEMSNFMDNAKQLGIFGDMLASNEFCKGRVPVLVMQCGEKRVKQLENKVVPGYSTTN
ncbi:cation/H(+) antiporter 15 [Cajanus cajan]|uniref:cation/H(+) antiporter 15 n=1 Tax=Cajanus cajan TaxID=3821 RepID=UPI00098D8F00|nr:cation/H(+) antiporter 15 [Cajanus cajan]